ncbi:MAG: hypothetical protein NWE89_04390 [Candidatus Bathyarchaeota archaeon]|nr:hypothetical protein [Candidatus Bathyarchaeota archaeon]
MSKLDLTRACPFASGVAKPDKMYVAPRPAVPFIKRLTKNRALVFTMAILGLTFVYTSSYGFVNTTGKPILFQDNYVIVVSLYSYVIGMITYFVKEYRQKKRKEI